MSGEPMSQQPSNWPSGFSCPEAERISENNKRDIAVRMAIFIMDGSFFPMRQLGVLSRKLGTTGIGKRIVG